MIPRFARINNLGKAKAFWNHQHCRWFSGYKKSTDSTIEIRTPSRTCKSRPTLSHSAQRKKSKKTQKNFLHTIDNPRPPQYNSSNKKSAIGRTPPKKSAHRECRQGESDTADRWKCAREMPTRSVSDRIGGVSDGCPPLSGHRYHRYRREIAGRIAFPIPRPCKAEWNREHSPLYPCFDMGAGPFLFFEGLPPRKELFYEIPCFHPPPSARFRRGKDR